MYGNETIGLLIVGRLRAFKPRTRTVGFVIFSPTTCFTVGAPKVLRGENKIRRLRTWRPIRPQDPREIPTSYIYIYTRAYVREKFIFKSSRGIYVLIYAPSLHSGVASAEFTNARAFEINYIAPNFSPGSVVRIHH